jgi:hypothetical protein
MKKALAGPAKRTAKKKPERRAMIAAARRRRLVVRVRAEAFTRRADKRLNALLVAAPRVGTWTRTVDRRLNRLMVRVWPRMGAAWGRVRKLGAPPLRWTGRRLRPVGVFALRRLAWIERRLLRLATWVRRGWSRVRAVLTPQRVICLGILVSAGFLLAAQFADYRAVEIGQPGYAGLPAAKPPTVDARTAGQASAYLLVPVALLAGLLAVAVLRNKRRHGLGRIVFALGLLSLAAILLVDLPSGTDVGAQASRFSGARAVLYDPFYIQIAAAIGLMLGGALLVLAPKAAARYHARPCRTRTNLFARGVSALRRRRPRRASSRGRGGRRASRRRNGAASAPASPR